MHQKRLHKRMNYSFFLTGLCRMRGAKGPLRRQGNPAAKISTTLPLVL